MEEVRFRLITPDDLAQELSNDLASDPEVTTSLSSGGEAEKDALRLGLVEAATIVGIAAGIAKVAEISFKAARGIISWMKSRRRDKTKIIVQGEHEDTLIEVDPTWTAEQLAERIRQVVTR